MTVIHQIKMSDSERDEIDRLPSRDRVTNWDIAGFVISIVSHIVDIFFDCNLAYRYYKNGNIDYFLTTLGFILIPALINTAFSIRMYVADSGNQNRGTTLTKKFTKRRICCVVVLLFQLAPVLRYFDALQYALKSKKAEKEKDHEKQRKYYELMVKEDSDVALLRVLECFLEAAPQQILQLTIIFHTHGEGISKSDTFTLVHQLLSIGTSFGSMAWSMASYQRLLRVALKDKSNISWPGTIVQFMWHFLVTVSRIFALSVMFYITPLAGAIMIGVHWWFMTLWIFCISWEVNHFCGVDKFLHFLFSAVYGVVFIFIRVSMVEGRTRYKYVLFYVVLFVETTAAAIMWIIKDKYVVTQLYYYIVILLIFVPFILGVICMLFYYAKFHPKSERNRPSSFYLFEHH